MAARRYEISLLVVLNYIFVGCPCVMYVLVSVLSGCP